MSRGLDVWHKEVQSQIEGSSQALLMAQIMARYNDLGASAIA